MSGTENGNKIWKCKDRELDYSRLLVMGILNVTPDSFSDGGSYFTPDLALLCAQSMEKNGADILDVGAESTRPGSEAISADEELSRLIPALDLIARNLKIPISVDTYKSKTAREALKFGASIVNDVWGLQKDPQMAEVVSESGAGVVIMANYTNPKIFAHEGNIVDDCLRFFEKSEKIADAAGIDREKILFDPGIGFGTDTKEVIELLQSIPRIQSEGYPLLIGPSRKRFIGELLDGAPTPERDSATASVAVYARSKKAACIRVHSVWSTVSALRMQDVLDP